MRKCKGIILVSNLFSVGATYGGVCKELAEQLASQQWHIITTSAVLNRWIRPPDMLATIYRYRNKYSVALIDVFSGSAFKWAELTTALLRRLGKPVVLILRGGNLPDFSSRHPTRVRKLLSRAERVTTPSSYLLEKMHLYHDDIRLIPNPVPIAEYTFHLRTAVKPNLLYLRALHKMYNPSMAIDVLELLAETYPDSRLVMVGPDKGDGARQDLMGAIESASRGPNVDVVGAVPKTEVPRYMDEADIFINTTNVDNTPISVIEAMASGLCIVSTDVGGIPYLLTHEHDALLVPPNDPQAMANAIRRILTEPGLAERLSRNARAKAEQFDWSVILPQWEELLLDVIERHQRG